MNFLLAWELSLNLNKLNGVLREAVQKLWRYKYTYSSFAYIDIVKSVLIIDGTIQCVLATCFDFEQKCSFANFHVFRLILCDYVNFNLMYYFLEV